VTTFFVGIGLLTLVAIALVVPPLLGWKRGSRSGAAASPVLVYADQLAELDADLAAGTLSREQYDAARQEIERRVLVEAAPTGEAERAPSAKPARLLAALAGLAIPVAALLIYVLIGTPIAMLPEAREGTGQPQFTQEQIEGMVAKLAERLEKQPDDLEGWVMLGRSYTVLGRFEDSAKAYRRAAGLAPNDAQVLADFADALGMAQGRKLTGEPEALIARAVKADPDNVKALALAGTVAFERGDYPAAIGHWERLLPKIPEGSPLRDSMQQGLEAARARLAGGGAAPAAPVAKASASAVVEGRVTLTAPAGEAPRPDDPVFVIARAADGPRVPVAVIKRQVKDLPFDFRLDDTTAMDPSRTLSSVGKVVVVARVARSQSPIPQAGDLESETRPADVGGRPIQLTIDRAWSGAAAK
jgi:cytochrome c-type biogenesis protein CcmH